MADRLEREIEEIIREKGDLPRPRRRGRVETPRRSRPQRARRLSLGPGAALMASVSLLVTALLLWSTAPGLGWTLVLGAALLFLLFFALAFGKGSMAAYEKRWRGAPIEGPSAPMKERFRAWWRRLRR